MSPASNASEHPVETLLADLLTGAAFTIGEVLVRRVGERFYLSHKAADESRIERRSENPDDARLFARFDTSGSYRPLKSAPNLPTDWLLSLKSLREVRLALDDFYPAALGMFLARREGRLAAVDFMETAGRQTGMYRIVGRIEPAMAQRVIGEACQPGRCQRIILWNLARGTPLTGLTEEKFESGSPNDAAPNPSAKGDSIRRVPIYCAEACNLLIAACRAAIKEAQKTGAHPTSSQPAEEATPATSSEE